jgi:adenylate cyclase
MGMEIERKFLVKRGWPKPSRGEAVAQGYLADDGKRSVRVRTKGAKAFLTVKSAAKGFSRREFEYPIPPKDAKALLRLCDRPPVRKTRYLVRERGREWEVDEFQGMNAGLVVAEIELRRENERFRRPDWLGREVTRDARYLNSALFRRPYRSWKAGKPG